MDFCRGKAGIGRHPMQGRNVITDKDGQRMCRACANERRRRKGNPWRDRKLAEGYKLRNGRFVNPEEMALPDKSDYELDREAAEWLAVRG